MSSADSQPSAGAATTLDGHCQAIGQALQTLRAAYQKVCQTLYIDLYRYVLPRLRGDHELAEVVACDALARGWEKIQSFGLRGCGNVGKNAAGNAEAAGTPNLAQLRGWLLKIARNLASERIPKARPELTDVAAREEKQESEEPPATSDNSSSSADASLLGMLKRLVTCLEDSRSVVKQLTATLPQPRGGRGRPQGGEELSVAVGKLYDAHEKALESSRKWLEKTR